MPLPMRLQTIFCLLSLLCALPVFARTDATQTPATTSVSSNKSDIRIGLSKDLLFSGFTDDGFLKYEMSAASATPQADVVSSVGVAGTWALNTVQLRLFHKGIPFATVTTADCLFSNRSRSERTASSPNELAMDSVTFRVNGRNWAWQNTPQTQIIKLQEDASMTLKARPSSGRVDIFSKRLEVTKYEQGTNAGRVIFVFSEDVRVIMENHDGGGDTTLSGEQLVVRLKNTGSGTEKITELAATSSVKPISRVPEKGENTVTKPITRTATQGSHLPDILENIEITGKVSISTRNRQMYGDRTLYDHASQTLTTIGNARIDDPAQHVSVSGGKIIYRHADARAEVLRADTGPDGTPPPQVLLSVPSFTARGEKADEADENTAPPVAHIFGDTLVLSMEKKTNHITMSGNVRTQDSGFTSSSQHISVETPHDARIFAGFTPGTPAPIVNNVIAEGNVRATYEGNILHCEKVALYPVPGKETLETAVLTGSPMLDFGNARLRGHTITLDVQKHQVVVISESGDAEGRQRVQVFLPAIKGGSNVATVVSSDRLLVVEAAGREKAKFDFTGNVRLSGFELEGQCAYLGLLADIRTPLPSTTKRKTSRGERLACIHNMTATGSVRLATPLYVAEGGEAVMLPRVALTEKEVPDDNGLDGTGPQFFTLRPHNSTPGKRPRLTFRPARAFRFGSLMPAALAAGEIRPAAKSTGKPARQPQGPIHMDCDLLEIIGGAMRSRFFLRGNVVLDGPDMRGGCGVVEGIIIEEKVPRNKQAGTSGKAGATPDPLPDYSINSITRIIGRENVRLRIKENEATGRQFEIFPQKKEIHLTGDPQVINEEGVRVVPGKAFIYNWNTYNWEMKGEDTLVPGLPINRPTIHIPMDEPLE